ncbi:MAG: signal peptidase II [Gemmatimonadetes bacterium]|nr:signal peptidase II [Gemmatimonadota bacterium]
MASGSPFAFRRLCATIVLAVFALDQLTKWAALEWLTPAYIPHRVVGSVVRLTLVYNPGAAFGFHLGEHSRWIFTGLTVVALGVLWRLYRETLATDRPRAVALALVGGGAFGNLLDRLRSPQGVVDFIDIGYAGFRWPTFNVADIAVSCGAALLAWVLWREEPAREAPAGDHAADAPIHG